MSVESEDGITLSRRRFVGRLVVLIGAILYFNTQTLAAFAKMRRLLSPDTDLGNLIYENPADLDIRELPLTPLSKFGVSGTDKHLVDLDTWFLGVGGLIRNPKNFSYGELKKCPQFERKVLLICPGSFSYVGLWQGFSLWDLLVQCGISSNATHIIIKGPLEKYRKVVRFPLDDIKTNKVFLAYAVNNQNLPREHGFPLRVVARDHVGAQWIKYVYRVEAVYRTETSKEKIPAESKGSGFFP